MPHPKDTRRELLHRHSEEDVVTDLISPGPAIVRKGSHLETSSLLARLGELTRMLSTATVADLLQLYLVDIDHQMEILRGAWKARDVIKLTSASHVIIGTSGNIGAVGVSAIARKINTACRLGSPENTCRMMDMLIAENAAAASVIRTWLNCFKSTPTICTFADSLN